MAASARASRTSWRCSACCCPTRRSPGIARSCTTFGPSTRARVPRVPRPAPPRRPHPGRVRGRGAVDPRLVRRGARLYRPQAARRAAARAAADPLPGLPSLGAGVQGARRGAVGAVAPRQGAGLRRHRAVPRRAHPAHEHGGLAAAVAQRHGHVDDQAGRGHPLGSRRAHRQLHRPPARPARDGGRPARGARQPPPAARAQPRPRPLRAARAAQRRSSLPTTPATPAGRARRSTWATTCARPCARYWSPTTSTPPGPSACRRSSRPSAPSTGSCATSRRP